MAGQAPTSVLLLGRGPSPRERVSGAVVQATSASTERQATPATRRPRAPSSLVRRGRLVRGEGPAVADAAVTVAVAAGPGVALRTAWSAPGEVRRSAVVHLQDASSWVAGVCALSAWLLRRPTVLTLGRGAAGRARHHGGWRGQVLAGPIEGWVARAAVSVEVTGPRTLTRMLEHGVDASRITMRPEGVDRAVFRPVDRSTRMQMRAVHGLPTDRPVVFVGEGRVAPGDLSGWSTIRPAARSSRREPRPQATTVAPTDGRLLAEYYQACDCFVRPESAGDLTTAAEQAMACGLPVVTADDLRPGDYGLDAGGFCVWSAEEDVASAVDRLLADRALYARLRSYSVRVSGTHLSAATTATGYRRMYDSAATSGAGPAPSPPGAERAPSVNRHSSGPVARLLLAVVTLLCVGAVLIGVSGSLRHQLELSVLRQPAPFTSLSFADPTHLPAVVGTGDRIGFVFEVANRASVPVTYRYVVTETGNRARVRIASGTVRVDAQGSGARRVDATVSAVGPTATVTVRVEPGGLTVAFHLLDRRSRR